MRPERLGRNGKWLRPAFAPLGVAAEELAEREDITNAILGEIGLQRCGSGFVGTRLFPLGKMCGVAICSAAVASAEQHGNCSDRDQRFDGVSPFGRKCLANNAGL